MNKYDHPYFILKIQKALDFISAKKSESKEYFNSNRKLCESSLAISNSNQMIFLVSQNFHSNISLSNYQFLTQHQLL
jgi:hypothetical protein